MNMMNMTNEQAMAMATFSLALHCEMLPYLSANDNGLVLVA